MKLRCYVLIISVLLLSQNSVNAGLFNFMKSCDKECVQANVCKDKQTAVWCQKNCSLKADERGRIYNGVCFEVLTQNATQNAQQVTDQSVKAIVKSCHSRITEMQYYPGMIAKNFPNKDHEIRAIINLMRQATQSIDNLEKSFANYQLATMTPSKKIGFGSDLSAYDLTCRRLTDTVTDFAYWAQNMIPMGGYKSLRAGTPKDEADRIFTATRDANIR